MSLAFPLGLLGLLSLPVIVALHMVRQRQQRYLVSSLKLWAFLQPEVHGTRPRKTPLSWLLVLDLLLASLFSLALAQPSLKLPAIRQPAKNVIILLDNSTSMLTWDTTASRFFLAQTDALELVSGLGVKDSASVYTFNALPARVGDTRQQDVQQIISNIQDLKAGATGHALRLALELAEADIDPDLPNEFHVFTDAAYPDPQISSFRYPLIWHVYGGPGSNQAIIDLSVTLTRNNLFQVYTEIANYNDMEVARNLTLFLDDQPVDSLSMRFPPNSVVSQVWVQQGEPDSVSVSLMGGDLLKDDDRATTGFRGISNPRIVIIADQPGILQKIQNFIPNANVQAFTSTDYIEQPAINLTIVKDHWLDDWPNGVVLLVQPPAGSFFINGEKIIINDQQTKIPVQAPIQAATEDPLFTEIDFSGVRWGSAARIEELPANFDVILQANLDQPVPLILRGQFGQSTLYLLMSDLDGSNFTRHPAFPIFLSKLAESSLEQTIPTALLLGQEIPLPDPAIIQHFSLTKPDGEVQEFSTDWQPSLATIGLPGLYQMEMQDRQGVETKWVVGVNAGELRESDQAPAAWAQEIRMAEPEVEQNSTLGIQLTAWLLGIAIVLLLLEAILAWR